MLRIFKLGTVLCLCIIALAEPPAASAIPRLMAFSGVLQDKDGRDVDGTFEITFRLYTTDNGGSATWEEKQTVAVSAGSYMVLLGQVKPLNVDFSSDLWLSVQIGGGKEIAPRFKLATVAYAFRAEVAENSNSPQGKKPADFALATHTHPAPDLSAYAKAADIKTYTAGNGLSLTGSTFSADFAGTGTASTTSRSDHNHDATYVNEAQASSVTSSMIVDGQIVDADIAPAAAIVMSKLEGDPKTAGTVNTGTNPIDWTKLKNVPAGLADGVDNGLTSESDPTVNALGKATLSCSSGQVAKWNGSAWACSADSDTTYTAGAGGGLSLAGTAFSLLGSCTSGQLLKWNGSAWACSADSDAGGDITAVTAGTGLTGGATTGAATLNVNFAGTGAATTASKSDHTHDSATASLVFFTCAQVTTTGTYYSALGQDTATGLFSTETFRMRVPRNGTFRNLNYSFQYTPAAAETITLMVNGVATVLSVSTTTPGIDSTNTVSTLAGDLFSFRFSYSGTAPWPGGVCMSVELAP